MAGVLLFSGCEVLLELDLGGSDAAGKPIHSQTHSVEVRVTGFRVTKAK
jgi:hypothetical protein